MGTFEFDGQKYKQASRHQNEWGIKLISELKLKGTEVILDLGCGDGALTDRLSLLVPKGRVLGIDASLGMISTAEKHIRDNLNFICMDINNMIFENEFDVIFSNAALHWIKDHKKLLTNAFKALKENGVILWNFAGDGNCSNFYDVIKKKIKEDKYKKYFHGFEWPWYMPSKTEYEELIGNIGFSEVYVEEENADRYFSDSDEMIRWIDQPSLVPFVKFIPDNMKETFRGEVIDEMLQRTLQSDGTCFETFRRIKVRGLK